MPTTARLRRTLLTGLAGVLGLTGFAGAAEAASGSPAGNLRVAIDSGASFPNPSLTAQRHSYVILHAWQTERMRQLKAANPELRVLVYKNFSASIASSNDGYRSTGVSYQEADSEHPEWFLKNTSGERFTHQAFSYLWAMDIGSPSYQRRWADNVVAELGAEGWDGVFLDDVNATIKYHYPAAQVAKYPTDAAYQQATESGLSHVGARIREAGKVAIPNIGSWGEYPAVGRRWLQHVDGGMDEMFVKWGASAGSGYAWDGRWETQLASLQYAQQQGKDFLAVTHSANGDAAAARYGWATVLLGAGGKASFALHADYTNENWFDFYEQDIGQPSGPAVRLDNGAWRRSFSAGVVAVNPTDATRTVNLGGAYAGPGGGSQTSIQLAPKTAAILDALADEPPTDPSEPPAEEPAIKPGKKNVNKKGQVVARGRVEGATQVTQTTGSRPRVRIVLRRAGKVQRRVQTQVGDRERFVRRVRVCSAGRYRVIAVNPATGQRAPFPGNLRIRPRQIRC